MNKTNWWRSGAAMTLAALLVACGGGGGGSDNSGPQSGLRAPLPTLSQDIAPDGARIDLRDQGYFVGAPGDTWIYDRIQNGSTSRLAVSRTVSGPLAGAFDVIEVEAGTSGSLTRYVRSLQGLVETDFLGVGDGALKSMIGDVLVYAEPFYAVGATRRVVRQGSAFEDLDGDGVVDSLRLEYSQVYLGQESVTLPDSSTAQAARFQNVATITTSGSSLRIEPLVLTFTEQTWWVAHVGMVRTDRSGSDSRGRVLVPMQTLQLAVARVGGQTLFQSPPVP